MPAPRTAIKAIVVSIFISAIFGYAPSGAQTVYEDSTDSESVHLKMEDWLFIPVLFATDRAQDLSAPGLSYSAIQREKKPGESGISYALKTIKVHPPKDCDLDLDEAEKLGWQYRKANSDKDVNFTDTTFREDDFMKEVSKAQNASSQENLLVFVHGCCCSHSEALIGAATLAAHYGVPIVAYDWASPPWDFRTALWNKGGYTANEDNSSVSEDRFSFFLDKLEGVIKVDSTSIVSHSMGNRLVENYFKDRHDRYGSNPKHIKFRRVDFCNADVYTSRMKERLPQVSEGTSTAVIHVNDHDPALEASRLVHANFRAGAPKTEVKGFLGFDSVKVIDHEWIEGITHDLPYWVTSDLYKYGALSLARGCTLIQKSSKEQTLLRIVRPKAMTNAIVCDKLVDARFKNATCLGTLSQERSYDISVTGTWTFDGTTMVGPDGLSTQQDETIAQPPQFAELPVGSLAARVGQGKPFVLKTMKNWRPLKSGKLFCVMNDGVDNDGYAKNSGQLHVVVTVK